jgi:Predicted hydrolases or acyltransferases (alpha/beta hydrolase superfamily)
MNPACNYKTLAVAEAVELALVADGDPGTCGFVFVHGILQAALSWKYQFAAPELSPWRRIAYDLRGHGFSSKPVGGAFYGDGKVWSDDLDAVLTASGLERAILVGWSFGGRVILDHLERGADKRVAGLVFLDANTRTAPGHISDASGAALQGALSPDMGLNIAARRQFLDLCFARPPTPEDYAEMLAYSCMTPPDVLRGMLGRPMDHDALMRRLEVPTLVLHGSEDRLTLPACATHTAATIPGAELHWLEGIGHAAQIEAPGAVNAALARFATRVFRAPG